MRNNTLFKVLCASLILSVNGPDANAQGAIYTVAGDSYNIGSTGVPGFAGAAGEDAGAVFLCAGGVATDYAGNVYVADNENHKIRKITPDGVVSTVDGAGIFGYTSMNGRTISSGMNSPYNTNESLTSYFNYCAYGSVIDDGGISNNPDGYVHTETPKFIWKDNNGSLLIVGNNRLYKLDGESNTLSTLTGGNGRGFSADGTPASSCLWGSISGICADNSGNVYVSDKLNRVVRVIDNEGHVRTIAGTGEPGYSGDGGFALGAEFRTPGALFINAAGDLFICDPSANVVRIMNVNDEAATIGTYAGTGVAGFSGDGGASNSADLNHPVNVWQDANGITYIADMGNVRVRSVVSSSGFKHSNTAGAASSKFNIFPNPSNGSFKVTLSTPTATGTIEIYNMKGSKVYAGTISGQQTAVNLVQPAGIYDVVLKSGITTTKTKISIEK